MIDCSNFAFITNDNSSNSSSSNGARSKILSMSVPFCTVGMCIGATFVLLAPMYSAKSVEKTKATNKIVVAEVAIRKGG